MQVGVRESVATIRQENVAGLVRAHSQWVILVVLVVLFSILWPPFLSASNLWSMLRSISVLGIVVLGQTFVVLAGGFDLSIAQLKNVAAITFAALLITFRQPWEVAVLGALAIAIALGFLNGVLITKVKLNAFLTTFGVGVACFGLARLIGSGSMGGFSKLDVPGFVFLGRGYIGPLPTMVAIFLVVAIIMWFLGTRSSFGRGIYACGNNEIASRMSGINVDHVRIKTYVLSGLLCGIGGLIENALNGDIRVGATTLAGFDVLILDTFAAVFLGGISALGGIGKMSGVIGAVLIIGVLSNGLPALGVGLMDIMLIKGVIILIAVVVDVHSHKAVGFRPQQETS